MERDVRRRNRRRARAQRMKAVGEKKCENGNETGDEEVSLHEKPPRPIHRRRKMREPLYEEDIIDGFAIASFKTYVDLERAVKQAERRGLKTLEPLPPPGASSIARRRRKSSDGRTQGGGHSSGDGYFCDHSASDDGKVSDSGSAIFPSLSKRESPVLTSSASTNGVAVVTSPHTTAGTTCVTAPSASRSLPGHQVVNGPRCSAPPGRGFLPHPGLASYPAPVSAPAVPAPAVRPPPPQSLPPRPAPAPAASTLPVTSSLPSSSSAVTAAPAVPPSDPRPPPGLASRPTRPPGPAPLPSPGRAGFAVRDLVSPAAAAAPVAAAGPQLTGRNNGCSPAPATLPTASTAGRAKPPRHKTSSGSPASAAPSRRQSPAPDRQHPFSVCGLTRLPGAAGSPLRTPPAAPARSPLSVGVFAPPAALLGGAAGLALPPVPLPGPGPPALPLQPQEAANKASDLLRRELDTRFLASQDRTLAVGPPPYLRSGPPTELHHHQHQHTHHHHHPPAAVVPPPGAGPPTLLKSVPKLGSGNSPFFRTSAVPVPGLPAVSPLAARPPAPPPPFLPAASLQLPAPKKTGRWNAMHVRIAWEIYKNQQKSSTPSAQDRPGVPSVPPAPGRPPEPPLGGGGGVLSPLLAGPAPHLRPPLLDVGPAVSGQPPPPHPLAAAGLPRFPSLSPAAASGAFSGLLPPAPAAFLERPGPPVPPPSVGGAVPGHPFPAVDSWGRLSRPAAPVGGWPPLKPESGPGVRPSYSPAEERRRHHSRSPLRLKAEPPEPRREPEERPELKARPVNGALPPPESVLYRQYPGPVPLDPYQAALSDAALQRDRQLHLYRQQAAADQLAQLQLERLARDRQLLDQKLLWGLPGPAPYGLRPPPPTDSLHLVNSFKSPYPGPVPGLGPPLGPLAGCSSAPVRRLDPPLVPGPPPVPGLPRPDPDPAR